MAEAPPPGVKSGRSCSRAKTFLIFGEGAISSSDSAGDLPSHDSSPDLERFATSTYFLRELYRGKWSLSATLFMFRLQEAEAVRHSLAIVAWEGGSIHCSSIMQSGAGAGET
jgi:hypothetical protein